MERGAAQQTGDRIRTWLIALIFVLALAWTLRHTVMVTFPIAASVLIALAVAPVSEWVQRHVPTRLHWLGPGAAMLVVLAALAIFVGGILLAGQQIASAAQQYLPQAQQQLERTGLLSLVGGGGGEQMGKAMQGAGSYLFSVFSTAWHILAAILLIFFLVLLMLIEAPDWRAKLETVGGTSGESKWDDVAAAVGQRFRRYFLTRMALGAMTGALYAGWLALFGVDLLLVWGLLAFLLNFVPTVGSLIAGALPALFVFAQKDLGTASLVAAGLLVIEQIMGNFVDPKLLGRQLSISPWVVLASLMLWSWIWGIAGALISVPMTVLITIVFAHIRPLRPIALFLSNERDMEALAAQTERR